jgi:serine/threonine-protein kinase RsbW
MMSPKKQTGLTLSQTSPSRMAEAESLCIKVRDLLQKKGLSRACFPAELLARESLNNAVLHGNRNDADKSILFRLWIGREWIRLQVTDQGPGFDWRKANKNRSSTTASSGRGLPIYALYAKRVQFNRRGNQITLWISKSNRTGKDDCTMAAYVIEPNDHQCTVKMTGDLTAVLVAGLQADLKEKLSKGVREVVFDLTRTVMLDSSGMGLLIASANSLAPSGGKIRVTNVSPDIFRLLQSMRLTARLNVTGKVE